MHAKPQRRASTGAGSAIDRAVHYVIVRTCVQVVSRSYVLRPHLNPRQPHATPATQAGRVGGVRASHWQLHYLPGKGQVACRAAAIHSTPGHQRHTQDQQIARKVKTITHVHLGASKHTLVAPRAGAITPAHPSNAAQTSQQDTRHPCLASKGLGPGEGGRLQACR